MINLKEIEEIKRKEDADDLFTECFELGFFSCCGIFKHAKTRFYPNRKIIEAAHCVSLSNLGDTFTEELRVMVREAVDWKKPWWYVI